MSLGIMDERATEIFVRTLSKTCGLRMQYGEDEDCQPYTDPINKVIHVARPRWHWCEEQYQCWLGAVCHELGHHREVNGEIMQYFTDKRVNTKSMYGTVVNLLMDWVNDAQWIKYPGAHMAVQAIQLRCATRSIAGVRSHPPTSDRDKMLCALFSWIYNRRAVTYQPGLMAVASEWADTVPHEYDIHNSELKDLLKNPTGPKVEELAKKICPPDEQDQEEQEQEGEGDPSEGGEGESGEQEGEGKDGEDEGEDKGNVGEISYRDLLISHDHSEIRRRVNIKYDHDWSDSYIPFNKYKEIDLSVEVR